MSQTYQVGDLLPTRVILGDAISAAADTDERVWTITSDCGANMKTFIAEHPDRFVDTGIAEQDAAGFAAGIALSGGIPYIMGMAPFISMRAFEQNRSAIAYQNLPVRIVGYVAGMTTGGGSTHYAMEDISIMRAVTNMTVISVSDPLLGAKAIQAGLDYDGPYYMRCGNGKADPVIYEPGSVDFKIGKGIVAREGSDITILTHGVMVSRAVKVADKLAADGIKVEVLDMFTIKPLDKELVLNSVAKTNRVLVWEDHYMYGGLASAVADLLTDEGIKTKSFVRVGIPAVYPGFGPDTALYKKFGMDEAAVEKKIADILA